MRSPGSWTPFLLRFGLRSLAGALFDNMTNMVNLGYNAFMRIVKIGDLKAQCWYAIGKNRWRASSPVKLRDLASKSAALSLAASLFHRERRDLTYPRQIR